jgi:anti-sigma regulatory factor (Ser/Thr protein kinase)
MSLKRQQRDEIKNFILFNLRKHPSDIVRVTQRKFGVSRQSVLKYIHDLITKGEIEFQGSTRNRKYHLKPTQSIDHTYQIQERPAEDKVWRDEVAPLLQGAKENVINICQYGFTEIFNNAIDHSEGTKLQIRIITWVDEISIDIIDNGIGIFNKIQKKYNLDDPLHSILELSKGKLTTEPESHSGEGIFFTSRMFDFFSILSGKLGFGYKNGVDLIMEMDEDDLPGTTVRMLISLFSKRTTKSVFDKFTSTDYGFDKTIVPVNLARYGKENLVSRSQAKRLLAHLDKFNNVILDFDKVPHIGRAFADEIFRVFVNAHPNTRIIPYNHNKSIEKLIDEISPSPNKRD